MPPKQTISASEGATQILKTKTIRKKGQTRPSLTEQYHKLTKRALRVQMRTIQKDFSS